MKRSEVDGCDGMNGKREEGNEASHQKEAQAGSSTERNKMSATRSKTQARTGLDQQAKSGILGCFSH